jgi:hypothetical protein
MARIGTSWNRIQSGDIITFNYKSKGTGKARLQTILVLNPKWYITVEGQRVFQLIGLKLAEQRVRTIKEASKVVTDIFNKLGTLEAIDEKKDIYRVRMKKQDLFWGGAKDIVYRRIRYLLNKEPIYRTYDWTQARKNSVFYESLPLPPALKNRILGRKNPAGERVRLK